MERGFRDFKYCLPANKFDTENDRIQLQSSNSDGVCILSLKIDGKQILVGKPKDQLSFWIDGNQNRCRNGVMRSSQITVQNGDVTSSECEGLKKFGQNNLYFL